MANLVARAPVASRCSYVFDGEAGYLDHALATASLGRQVAGVTIWHINADELSVLDYNTEFKSQDLWAPTPYRSSDHDPVVVGCGWAGKRCSCRWSCDDAGGRRGEDVRSPWGDRRVKP